MKISSFVILEKGKALQKTFNYEDIEQILAEADELLRQIDPEILEYMEEEKRIQLGQQAQILKKLKSEIHDKTGKEGAPEGSSYSEGVHEAIEDVVTAMKGVRDYPS